MTSQRRAPTASLVSLALMLLSCTKDTGRPVMPISADGENLPQPEPSTTISRSNPSGWPPQITVVATSWADWGWQNANVRSQMWWGAVAECTDPVPQRRFGQQSDGSYTQGPPPQSVNVQPPAAEVTGTRIKVYVSTLHVFFEGAPYASYAEEYTTEASECYDAPPGAPPPPALNATLYGPSTISAEGWCSWYGSVSGGTPPYSVFWKRNGEPVASGYGYTAETQGGYFYLEFVVTDAPGNTVTRSLSVSEDPNAPTCPF